MSQTITIQYSGSNREARSSTELAFYLEACKDLVWISRIRPAVQAVKGGVPKKEGRNMTQILHRNRAL